jgi:hypothetical protein
MDEQLATVCKKLNITESAYLSDLLRKQLLVEPLSVAFQGMTLGRFASRFIVGFANKEAIDVLGAEVARRDIPVLLNLLDLSFDEQSLWTFIRDIAADCWKWFRIGLNPKNGLRIVLYHDFGMNWSIFLRSYLSEAFGLVSNAPPRVIAMERLVRLDLNDRVSNHSAAYNRQEQTIIMGQLSGA